jgi:hypothetical protein
MTSRTVVPLLVATLTVGAGCGSGGGGGGGRAEGRLAPEVAAGLAARAEQVAVALEAGHCDEALDGARALQSDIAALTAEPAVRAEALTGAARLVNGISCPRPVITVPVLAPPEKERKGKGSKGDHDDD